MAVRRTLSTLFRGALWTALALVVVAVLAVAGAELALRSGGARDLVVSRISSWLEGEYGTGVEVDDLSLSILGGWLEMGRLAVRAGDAEPFLRVDRVRADWRATSVLTGSLWVDGLTIERPAIDLGRPLPVIPETGETSGGSEPPVRVDSIRVTGASVHGMVPTGAENLLRGWRIAGGEVVASLDGSRFTVSPVRAALTLELAPSDLIALSSVDLEIESEAAGRFDGEIDVERIVVVGEALELEGSALVGIEGGALSTSFRAVADAATWLAGEKGAPVVAEGTVDLAGWSGRATLSAESLPGSLLEKLVGDPLFAELELAATTAALEARVELVDEKAVRADISLDASRDGETILAAVLAPRVVLPDDGEAAISLTADLDLRAFPGEPGERRLTAALDTTDVAQADRWQIVRGKVELDVPNVDALASKAASLWPRLLGEGTLAALPPLGRVTGGGSLAGSLLAPDLDASLEWSPHEGSTVTAELEGRLGGDLRLSSEGTAVSLGHFVDGIDGRLEWSGSLRGSVDEPIGGLHAAVWDLARDEETLFEMLDVRLEGDRRSLDWALDGSMPGFGALEGRGSAVPERILRRLSGDLTLEPADGSSLAGLDRIDGSFGLTDGVLEIAVAAHASGEEALRLDGELPLASLASIPGAEAVAGLPIERTSGPLDVAWMVARRDWRGMVSEAWSGRLKELSLGSSGRIELDVDCPGCSRAYGELTGLVAEVDGREVAATGSLGFALGDGLLRMGPWTLAGEDLSLTLDGFAELDTSWRLGGEPPDLVVDAGAGVDGEIGSAWLTAFLSPEAPLQVLSSGTAAVRGTWSWNGGDAAGGAVVESADLVLGSPGLPEVALAQPRIEVELAGGTLTLERAEASLGGGSLTVEGVVPLADPLDGARGTARIQAAVPVIDELEIPFELRAGRLTVENGRLSTQSGDGVFGFEIPLEERAGRVTTASWDVPASDWAPLLTLFTHLEEPSSVVVGSVGELRLDLENPAKSEGIATVSEAVVSTRGRSTSLAAPASITMGGGELRLSPARLVSGSEVFDLGGRGSLNGEWKSADRVTDLVSSLVLEGNGTLDSALINPFLAGGRAEGPVAIELALRGTPAALSGDVRISGPEASILYRAPYLTRISSPQVVLAIGPEGMLIDDGSARLNNGPLEFTGLAGSDGRAQIDVTFDDSLFRVDYGLLATVDGDIRYETASDGTALVSGKITVERGSLTRDIQIDYDLLTQLLAPIDLSTTEDDPLDLIRLDLEVRTREGVRVKNNVGDLLVRWEPLAVSGSVAKPIIEGRVEVDPGGFLHAYGQTVRLDRAAIEYPGEDGVEPRLDFEATTSLDDPTIGQLSGDDPFREVKVADENADLAAGEVTADLARYYGEQFAGKVGESVGVKLSLRPLMIFGETDPGARLTISRDLSPNFAVAASVDLRQAEGQTYLLELHELRTLPRLVAQAFTDDTSAYGGALLQRQEFGGSEKMSDSDLPRISKIVARPSKGVSRRSIKRALALEKGDAFDARERFVAEVELLDYLMDRGYPDARVSVDAVPEGRRERRVRLEIDIEPGPYVAFRFEGEKIAKPLRAMIRSLYRPDFFEPESIEEMRAETVRALRSRGFLKPSVEISVEPADVGRPEGDRTVIVRTVGGIKMSTEPPVFRGLPTEDAAALGSVFANTVQRVELAVGLPSADNRLLKALAALGHPEATVGGRYQSLGERVLTVEIDPGPRERIASVTLEVVEEVDLPDLSRADLEKLLLVGGGDPLRRMRVSRSVLALERDLASRGYLDARAEAEIVAVEGEEHLFEVTFRVDPGTLSRLGDVEFTGLRATRPKWARRVAGLETGAPLAKDDLSRARTSLWRTGLFSGVSADTIETEPGVKRVVFDLAERSRYRLTYGVRWDSGDGMGAVFDATDDNFLGRSWLLGLRALYSNEEKSLRWVARVPRAFGGPGSVEFFAAVREFTEDACVSVVDLLCPVPYDVDRLEGTVQYSHPLTDRSTFRTYVRYTDQERIPADEFPFLFPERYRNPQIGFQYVYDSRGPETLAEQGIFASVDLSGSREFLGGDLQYVRLFSQFNLYRPIGRPLGRRLSWSQSFRVGMIETFDQVLVTDRDVRFFAGGEYSVRGYETESLGPIGDFGPTGGAALFVANQELRWRLWPDYVLVLFADAGNVWEETGDLLSELMMSTGIGVRAQTPVGLLRLDIARPLDRRIEIDPAYKIYFGIGTTF